MLERKNIFRIARSRAGPEDQLTELLAFLWQEEPELLVRWLATLGIDAGAELTVATQRGVVDGRLDIEVAGAASVVIVESKLGSTTSFEQMQTYIAHARDAVPTGERAIVLLTQSHEEWPLGIKELASAPPKVRLIRCRWQALGESVREHGDVLAQDFVHMLEREDLVTPDPIRSEDWGTWSRAGDIAGRLWALLDEVRPEIETFADGYRSASRGVGTHWLYRNFRFQSIEIGVGFASSRRGHVMGCRFAPARPAPERDDDPVIYAWAYDPTLADDEYARAANDAVSSAAKLAPESARGVSWGANPSRVAIASAIVVASDFQGQLADVVAFARETASLFARAGYGSTPRARA